MRWTDATVVTLAAAVLAAGIAAHGVHDRRGRVRVESGQLQVELETAHASSGADRCLDLLDELHVRDGNGRRLVGTGGTRADDGRCRLSYRLAGAAGRLTLQFRPSRTGAARGERLVLQPSRGDDPHGDALLLSGTGNVEALSLEP